MIFERHEQETVEYIQQYAECDSCGRELGNKDRCYCEKCHGTSITSLLKTLSNRQFKIGDKIFLTNGHIMLESDEKLDDEFSDNDWLLKIFKTDYQWLIFSGWYNSSFFSHGEIVGLWHPLGDCNSIYCFDKKYTNLLGNFYELYGVVGDHLAAAIIMRNGRFAGFLMPMRHDFKKAPNAKEE